MLAEWKGIVEEETWRAIDEFGIWDLYPLEMFGVLFLVSNGRGSSNGEVHVYFRPPTRLFRAGPKFMEWAWGRTGLDRLHTWITKGNTQMAAWAKRYGWRNTHEPGLLGTEMWEIRKW